MYMYMYMYMLYIMFMYMREIAWDFETNQYSSIDYVYSRDGTRSRETFGIF